MAVPSVFEATWKDVGAVGVVFAPRPQGAPTAEAVLQALRGLVRARCLGCEALSKAYTDMNKIYYMIYDRYEDVEDVNRMIFRY